MNKTYELDGHVFTYGPNQSHANLTTLSLVGDDLHVDWPTSAETDALSEDDRFIRVIRPAAKTIIDTAERLAKKERNG